jgi:DNA polymerase III delta subunit
VAAEDAGDKVDKRLKGYKGLVKRGPVLELNRQKPAELENWLVSEAGKERDGRPGKKLSRPAARLLVDRGGANMQVLHSELEKALLYCLDADRIDEKDIEKLVGRSREEVVWAAADAALAGDSAQAMELVDHLMADGTYPLVILTLFVRQVRHLLQARLLWEDAGRPPFGDMRSFQSRVLPGLPSHAFGGGPDDVTGIHPFASFRRFEAARGVEIDDACALLARARRADLDVKTGGAAGIREALEELLLDVAARARTAGRAA